MSYEDCFEMGCTSIDLQGISEYLTPVIKIRQRDKLCYGDRGETTLPSQVTPEVEPKQPSRSFIVGDIGGDFKPIGSPIMSDNVEISGTVAESINQLPVSPDSTKPSISIIKIPLLLFLPLRPLRSLRFFYHSGVTGVDIRRE